MNEPLTREEVAALAKCEDCNTCLADRVCAMGVNADRQFIATQLLVTMDERDTLRRELTEERERGARLAGVVEAARVLDTALIGSDETPLQRWIGDVAAARKPLHAALATLDSDGA